MTLKILIVDDDSFSRTLTSAMVQEIAAEAITAASGQEAIDLIQSGKEIPDIILMDVVMPEMNGYQAAEHIKSMELNRHIPIIFLTALSSDDSLTRCLDYGDDFIAKPVSQEVLQAKIMAHSRFVNLYNELQVKNDKLTYFYKNTEYEQGIVREIFSSFTERNEFDKQNIRFNVSPMSTFNGDIVLGCNDMLGNQFILIADITGHGLPAAIGLMPVCQTFFSMVKQGATVGRIAEAMNKHVADFLPSTMLCAATIVELSNNGERMTVWSGGLPGGIIVDGDGAISYQIHTKHMPLGALGADEFSADIELIELKKSDRIYFYTDGIVESSNLAGEMFGDERVLTAIKEADGDIFSHLLKAVETFCDGRPQDDDITLVELTTPETKVVEKTDEEAPPMLLPLSLTLTLKPRHLRSLEPVPYLRQVFESIPGIENHIDFITTILSEMYANSLEHGVLKLESADKQNEDEFIAYYSDRQSRLMSLEEGQIEIKIDFCDENKPCLKIMLIDSGDGFDTSKVISRKNNDEDSHGRGIELMSTLCEEITYNESGNALTIVYELKSDKLLF